MKIVVLIKQTPDTESVIRIAEDGKSIVTDGLKWIINPYDEFALEAALRLKEKDGGTLSVLSLGPQRVVNSMITALAMGADDATIIDDPALDGADALGTATILSAAIEKIGPDIVLCGSRAIDCDQAQTGAMVAEILGWPHLPVAVAIEADQRRVTIERRIEGGTMSLRATLPALVTVGGSHSVWNPRYASLPGIIKAKKKPLAVRRLSDLGLDPAKFGLAGAKISVASLEKPPQRSAGRIVEGGDAREKARELARALHEDSGAF
ncbi:MAG: electron transfer flavoprotein subunit beta/FixA family protein [Desulfobacteraceae bacterium]|nr:electron transfer flavoprotein subunit beta/FixA family protein [Desulfobacteraceae bacterium]